MQNDPVPSPILHATHAPPLATHAPPPRKLPRVVWIGGAIAGDLFALLLCAGAGIGVSKLIGWKQSLEQVVDKQQAQDAKPKDLKPIDQWNYQDIQDHLANQGMRTSRGLGKRGMLFVQEGKIWQGWGIHNKGDGEPLKRYEIENIEDTIQLAETSGTSWVSLTGTSELPPRKPEV